MKIINDLREQFPDFKLFFDHRFEIIQEHSLKPEFDRHYRPIFEPIISVRRKDIDLNDLKEYHRKDIELWKSIQ